MLSNINCTPLRGTLTNVADNGLVAFTNTSVELKTAQLPIAPHQIISQKNGTSRNGML